MFKKKLSKVLSSLTTIQSDLKEVISDEVSTQKDIDKKVVRLKLEQADSQRTMDKALTVLGNVDVLLGK